MPAAVREEIGVGLETGFIYLLLHIPKTVLGSWVMLLARHRLYERFSTNRYERAAVYTGELMRLAGMPYLHVALSMGGVPENIPFVDAIVPVLVEAGAAWNASDRFGRSAVHVAAQHGLLKHVKAGIEADADLLLWLDSNNQTVLHVAAM